MKKILSLLVALIMLFALAVPGVAEVWQDEATGLTATIPDEFTVEDLSEEGYICLEILNPAEEGMYYYLTLEFSEDYEGITLNDLNDEELAEVLSYFAEEDVTYEFDSIVDEELGLYFALMADEGGTLLNVIGLVDGWICVAQVVAEEDLVLSENAVETLILLLQGLSILATVE